MAKTKKIFKVVETKRSTYGNSEPRTYSQVGTLDELIQAYSYSLEVGESWQHEQGNKKINRNPRGIKTLVTNLENAANNAAANGYSGCSFEEVTPTPEDLEKYNQNG